MSLEASFTQNYCDFSMDNDFDANLKQIEQTNSILNNIESKLNRFFNNRKDDQAQSQLLSQSSPRNDQNDAELPPSQQTMQTAHFQNHVLKQAQQQQQQQQLASDIKSNSDFLNSPINIVSCNYTSKPNQLQQQSKVVVQRAAKILNQKQINQQQQPSFSGETGNNEIYKQVKNPKAGNFQNVTKQNKENFQPLSATPDLLQMSNNSFKEELNALKDQSNNIGQDQQQSGQLLKSQVNASISEMSDIAEYKNRLATIENKQYQLDVSSSSIYQKPSSVTVNTGVNNSNNNNNVSTSSSGSILMRMQKIEEFYQNRTRILEDRINTLEQDVERLQHDKSELMQENNRQARELDAAKERCQQDLQRELSVQEEKLNRHFEMNLKGLSSKNQELLNEQITEKENLAKQIDKLKNDKTTLVEEIETIKTHLRNIEDEKSNFSQSYNQLLGLHNQMLQLDIQKHETSLLGSLQQSQSSATSVFSNANKLLNCLNNISGQPVVINKSNCGGIITTNSNNPMLINERKQSGAINNPIDVLQSYKQELDQLKQQSNQNNDCLKKQIDFLKKELDYTKQENQQLKQEMALQTCSNNGYINQQQIAASTAVNTLLIEDAAMDSLNNSRKQSPEKKKKRNESEEANQCYDNDENKEDEDDVDKLYQEIFQQQQQNTKKEFITVKPQTTSCDLQKLDKQKYKHQKEHVEIVNVQQDEEGQEENELNQEEDDINEDQLINSRYFNIKSTTSKMQQSNQGRGYHPQDAKQRHINDPQQYISTPGKKDQSFNTKCKPPRKMNTQKSTQSLHSSASRQQQHQRKKSGKNIEDEEQYSKQIEVFKQEVKRLKAIVNEKIIQKQTTQQPQSQTYWPSNMHQQQIVSKGKKPREKSNGKNQQSADRYKCSGQDEIIRPTSLKGSNKTKKSKY